MRLKANNSEKHIIGWGADENSLWFTFPCDEATVEDIEELLSDVNTIEMYEEEEKIGAYHGYTKLVSVQKLIDEDVITARIEQPFVRIKGNGDMENLKLVLESLGYVVEE